MNNEQIIQEAALSLGLYTEEEIEDYAMQGESLPFHTFTVWKSKCMVPKKGVHGYEVHLWKRRKKKEVSEEDPEVIDETEDMKKGAYYKTKAILFNKDQVEVLDN